MANNVESPLYNNRLLTWRQQLSPVRGLTMSRLVMMFQNHEMGYKADLQWLYTYIERRDAVLKAVLERRLSSLKKLDFNIKIKEEFADDKQAEAQKEYLEEIYNGIDNLKQAVEFLGLASFRGFSHLEKHWSNDGDLLHLEPVPQYLFAQKLPSRDWLYNAKAFQTATGVPIDPTNFIIRDGVRPANEIAAIMFVRKGLSQRDYDGFIEGYGIPPLFITLPQGVGAGAIPGQPGGEIIQYYQDLAERVISDGRGVLPFGATIVNPTKDVTSHNPFLEHIRYCDEQIVLAATSGLLTSLTSPTGMNSDQGETHENTFNSLAKAEALEISEIFQQQLDVPMLDEKFAGQEVMVYFELSHEDLEDDDPIEDAKGLAQAGYEIDPDQLSEATGYKLTLKPQPGSGMGAGGGGGGGNSYSTQSGGDPYAGEDKYSDWLNDNVQNKAGDVIEKIRNALKSDDDAIFRHLEELEKKTAGV